MNVYRNRLALAVAVATLALAGCSTGGSSDGEAGSRDGVKGGPGVDLDSKTITVTNIAALSGPAEILNTPLVAGLQTYWDARNASGGIDGWKIKLVNTDSANEAAQHVQKYAEVKDNTAILGSFGGSTTKAILPQLTRDKLVATPQGFDSSWGASPVLAPVGTPFAIDAANVLEYVTDGGTKDLKIGLIYQNDESGSDIRRGYETARDELGFDDVGIESAAVGATDVTAQVQKMKADGADAVYLGMLPNSAGAVVGTAATLGYAPQWLFASPAFIENLFTEDGVAGSKPTPIAPALTGTILTMFAAAWGDESVPGMKQMITDQEKYAPDQNPSVYFTYGYAQGALQAAILEKAISDGDLSRDGIFNAKINLGTVDLQGLVPSPTYGDQVEPPSRTSIIQELDPDEVGFRRPLEDAYVGKVAEAFKIG